MRITIDRSGRLVIPKQIRDIAGLWPGVQLDVEYRDGKIEMETVSRVKLVRKGSLLVATVPRKYMRRKLTHEDTMRILGLVRQRKL
ncbi:MAG: AbrB/MazE/SpoVT family DNA-binding domain-containing protein [Acidobacteria bacterium]|nr:AbrB/MazE/SpoVT family DNA-binding domain-containing protein [Acidobacteriota bacterium]